MVLAYTLLSGGLILLNALMFFTSKEKVVRAYVVVNVLALALALSLYLIHVAK